MSARASAVLVVMLTLSAAVAQDDVETLLRHDNFLVFEAEAGEVVPIAVTSIRKAGFIYGDDLTVEVIDPNSERALRRLVPLGTAETIEFTAAATGMHAVRLAAGWNTVQAEVVGRPWALVAWQDVPVNICGAMAPLYFKVLENVESFKLSVSASVTGEAATVRIYGPDGQAVLDKTGDFDSPEKLEIEVPEGADGAVWCLTITDPEEEGLELDDVAFFLSGRIPPLLCEDPDWVEVFAAGEEYQPDLIDTVVQASDEVRLDAGQSATVAWQMAELPEGKTYALRVTGNDVDYPKELMLTINEGEPIAVPVTGNSTTETFTILIEREMLRQGENTMTLSQDPSGGSNVVLGGPIEVLIGDRISEFRGY